VRAAHKITHGAVLLLLILADGNYDSAESITAYTGSSAIAEGPRDASCQSKLRFCRI